MLNSPLCAWTDGLHLDDTTKAHLRRVSVLEMTRPDSFLVPFGLPCVCSHLPQLIYVQFALPHKTCLLKGNIDDTSLLGQ